MMFVLQEEFCYPMECLALTVEEVMHIRQVLVKAELEKFQQYKDIYTALKKGKVDMRMWFFCFFCSQKDNSQLLFTDIFHLTSPSHLCSFSSFAFHVETRGFLFSHGRTPASSAKGKVSCSTSRGILIKMSIRKLFIRSQSLSLKDIHEYVICSSTLTWISFCPLQACLLPVLKKGRRLLMTSI